MSSPLNLFLDTQIFVDYIKPERREKFPCSKLLIENVKRGYHRGWTIEYVLSELLGELKGNLEKRKGFDYLKRDALSRREIEGLVKIIENVKMIPNLEVFKTPVIEQKEIFGKVKNLCIETKDALVLISALHFRRELRDITIVTRDNRFLIRAKREIATGHPSEFIGKCPTECLIKNKCRFRK